MGRRIPYRRSFSIASARKGGRLVFALYFVCAVLLVLSRLDHDVVRAARNKFTEFAAPVLETASLPATYARRLVSRASDYVDGVAALDRLKAENARLRQWRWRAKQLERRLAHMRKLLNGVEEPALKFATGRVIADARGPFVRSVLLNIGKAQSVKLGYAVINADGLIGRTVDVGQDAARVIMLTDLNSRIPVLVGPGGARAILVGDNSPEPRLEFLSESDDIYEKDGVYTSGHGGLLPRGLRVGVVALDGGRGFRVRLHARLDKLEYASVLFFDSPVILAREAANTETLTLGPRIKDQHAEMQPRPASRAR